jgi:hypothetical protein
VVRSDYSTKSHPGRESRGALSAPMRGNRAAISRGHCTTTLV